MRARTHAHTPLPPPPTHTLCTHADTCLQTGLQGADLLAQFDCLALDGVYVVHHQLLTQQ